MQRVFDGRRSQELLFEEAQKKWSDVGPHFKVATGAITWAFCWGAPASKIRLAPRPGHRHVS